MVGGQTDRSDEMAALKTCRTPWSPGWYRCSSWHWGKGGEAGEAGFPLDTNRKIIKNFRHHLPCLWLYWRQGHDRFKRSATGRRL